MGIRPRLSFLFNVSLFSILCYILITFRISSYGTASTDSAAYILGGYGGDGRISTIAQFQNNEWQKIGNLKEIKSDSSAILHGGEYLIIGGDPNSYSGRSVH